MRLCLNILESTVIVYLFNLTYCTTHKYSVSIKQAVLKYQTEYRYLFSELKSGVV